MATYTALPLSAETLAETPRASDRRFAFVLVSALTPTAVLIHGYHPYAEDGGLYLAGVKRLLDPTLYPHGTAFVTEHLRFSFFAPFLAGLAHVGPLSLPALLLLLHLASIWITLYAAWLLASRCFPSRPARAGAVALLACWLDLPIAGTALLFMDPYLTARSLSTPCMLLALAGVLDIKGSQSNRGLVLCLGTIAAAALVHPLMAAYALGSVLVLACLRSPSRRLQIGGSTTLCLASIAGAAILNAHALGETPAYLRVVLTRPYWFLSQWRWFELAGLIAPLCLLLWNTRQRRIQSPAARTIARTAVIVGTTALAVALPFARQSAATHLVARLQPLRVFQIVYAVMILLLGANLGERFLRRSPPRWIATVGLLGGIMCFAARATYPASDHVELPWTAPANPWVQAFLWARNHTPKDALFALDADYISHPAEDAQCFRALAERSTLPDYSKDGGEASITPTLAGPWLAGLTAQTNLSTESDAARHAALDPLGVTWLILEASAPTGVDCPYTNPAAKVCRLR